MTKMREKMMNNKIKFICCGLALFLTQIGNAKEAGFGMLMDAEGEVLSHSNGQLVEIGIGEVIPYNTKISIPDNSLAIITVFDSCQEWELNGNGEYLASKKGLLKFAGQVPVLTRQLPVCFDPEEFADAGSLIGGLPSRSMSRKDPMTPLWQEAATGNASNTTLMILVMNGVKHRTIARVRPYFEILKQRIPNSPFIMQMRRYF